MRTFAFALVLFVAAFAVAAPVPPPGVREAEQLVEKLGSEDYRAREAANQRLDELGELALDALRAACKSQDPEIANRAKELLRKIERRVASERLLSPTMVELNTKDIPLDEVLAALSQQSGYEVVLSGLKPEVMATKKITMTTRGKVPFWSAVVKVCDAAGLQVAGVGGYLAPGSIPYRPFARKNDLGKLRVAAHLEMAVVLESRDGKKPRPASVHGAVLVEAFPLPKETLSFIASGAALQVWPEPRLVWQTVTHVKIAKVIDRNGRKLSPVAATPPAMRFQRPGSRLGEKQLSSTTHQAYLSLKSVESQASEFAGSILGLVRAAIEPLATITLDPKKAVTVKGLGDVELTAFARTDAAGKNLVDVKLMFSPSVVDAARTIDDLPGVKPDTIGSNHSILGVRITDSEGTPFDLALADQRSEFDRNGRRIITHLTLEVVIAKDGHTTPAKVTFWGTTIKPTEVPFALQNVPLK